jgi:hypothetical protein
MAASPMRRGAALAAARTACEAPHHQMMSRVMWFAAVAACSGRSTSAVQPAAPPPVVMVADAAGPDTAPLDQDLPRLVQRSLAVYDEVASAFQASGSDCAAASTRLEQLAGRYRDVAAANAKVLRDGRTEELRAALEVHGDAFDRAAQAVMQSPTMTSCGANPVFAKAFDDVFQPP